MNILITGGTGLLGMALISLLRFDKNAHKLTVFARNYAKACRNLHASIDVIDSLSEVTLKDFDAIINLAGEPIVDKRWSNKRKHLIEQSRLAITQGLVDKINAECNPERPITFISGSAVGIYGLHNDGVIDEQNTTFGDDFGSQLCQQWENIAYQAKNARVVTIRTGIVLSNQGGALTKMLPPFWSGFGGKIASGKQYMPWIHIKDWTAAIQFILQNNHMSGPINITAPNPVTNQVFTTTLGSVLKRPAILTVPKFVLRLMLGESAELVLYGQNAVPGKLLENDFKFKYEQLEPALDNLLLV